MSLAESLTLGEIERIEQQARAPITSLEDAGKPKGALLIAIATVIRQRSDPTFTRKQAAELSMADVQKLMGVLNDDADPTNGQPPSD